MEENNNVKKYNVVIFGSEYTVKGDIDEEYINKLAKYVDQKMTEISEQTKIASTQRLAVLTALYIADELFSKESSGDSADYGALNESLKELIKKIDIELQL